MPAISPDAFLKPQRPHRQIHAKNRGFDTKYIVENHQSRNTKFFIIEQSNTVQYSSSFFFIKTVRDWNNLEEATVCVDSVEGFVSALHSSD